MNYSNSQRAGVILYLTALLFGAYVIAGTSVSFVKRISTNEKYNKLGTILKIVMGMAILLIGFYMFWLAF